MKGDAPEEDVAFALVVAQLFRLEGAVRWLDVADARLGRRPAAGPASVADESRPVREAEVRR